MIKTKNRSTDKPFPIMCADENQIKSIAIVGKIEERIIQEFMPGPSTIILNKNPELPDYVSNGRKTIAVWMATSKTIKELIKRVKSPIFMSSANKSGEPTCKNLDEIEKSCPNLDGMLEGKVLFEKGSTIVDCISGEIKILRNGPITIEEIKRKIEI